MESNNFISASAGISTALLAFTQPSDGIFSRVTMTSLSSEWYQRLSPFESLLVGIVILQVFVLRYLEILPIDINHGFHYGFTPGKRKRRSTSEQNQKEIFSETFFTLLRRIDQYDCLLRSLCELRATGNLEGEKTSSQWMLSKDTLMTVKYLERSAMIREKYGEHTENNRTISERPVISVFEEAVLYEADGECVALRHSKSNATCISSCERRYALCPLPTEDLLDLVTRITL